MGYRVEIANIEHTLISLSGETLLDTLQRCGYGLRTSCCNGVCEICEVQLLYGDIVQRYPEKHLSLKEDNKKGGVNVLACTCVPQSDIRVNIEGILLPGELPVKKLLCDIAAVKKLNSDVFQVNLQLPATATLAVEFHAGQYLDIILPDGKQASFSIGSAPDNGRELELHIRHVPDSEMSCAIVTHLQNEKTVEIELPKGDCYLDASSINPDTRLIFAAASTGFAQVKSVVEHLLANQITNDIHIYWGARVEEDMYLESLPILWVDKFENVHFSPVVSEPDSSPGWAGRTGLLPAAVLEDYNDFENVEVFASGSPAMVYALLDACESRGFSEKQMHSDVFAYAPRPEKS